MSPTEELTGFADLVLMFFAASVAYQKTRSETDKKTFVRLRNELEKVAREILADYRGEQMEMWK